VPRSRSIVVTGRASEAVMIAVWPYVRRIVKPPRSVPSFVVRERTDPPRLALRSSVRCLATPTGTPPRTRRMASASVDFPLPRGPITQIKPVGKRKDRSDRNPPVIPTVSIAQSATLCLSFPKHECRLTTCPRWRHATPRPRTQQLKTLRRASRSAFGRSGPCRLRLFAVSESPWCSWSRGPDTASRRCT
jgi:hypothetical protein